MANYLENTALAIYQSTGGKGYYEKDEASLWLGYAVLLRAKGTSTTSSDVHDVWSLWRTLTYPQHVALIPFADLTERVRQMDDEYRDAIHRVAMEQVVNG